MRESLILPAILGLVLVSFLFPAPLVANASASNVVDSAVSSGDGQNIGIHGCPIQGYCSQTDPKCIQDPFLAFFPVITSNQQCGFCPSFNKCGFKLCGGMYPCLCGPYQTSGYPCDTFGSGC